MTKQEYNEYILALKARGYKLGGIWYNNPFYSKVIECRKNEDGDSRAVCQLIFKCCETKDERIGYVYYSIVPAVVVSRNTAEWLDFTISHPKRSIEECERIAKEFMRWVDMYIDTK